MQDFRNTIIKQQVFGDEILKYYGESKILYSNFGFIVIPKAENCVYKIYFSPAFFEKYNISGIRSAYEQEKYAYRVFRESGFLLPQYESIGEQNFGEFLFPVVRLENIRTHYRKIDSFLEIPVKKLGEFLSKVHRVEDGYIHGNFHPSNMFLSGEKIGIFDLASFYYGEKEQDIARILINAKCSLKYLYKFLDYYEHEYNIRKILYFAMSEIRYVMTIQSDNHEQFKKYLFLLSRELSRYEKG